MDIQNQINYHQTLLDGCTTLISACDNKASFALAFVGVIVGVAVSNVSYKQASTCVILEYACYIATILLAASCILFLLTIIPRGNLKVKDNFIIDCMNSISDDSAYLNNLKEQIKDSAQIYSRKCFYYKWGTIFLVISIVMFFALKIVSSNGTGT